MKSRLLKILRTAQANETESKKKKEEKNYENRGVEKQSQIKKQTIQPTLGDSGGQGSLMCYSP